MTFTTILPDTDSKVAVLFDPSTSNFSDATKANAGFRVAMIAGDEVIIFGNDDHLTHVKEVGSFANFTKATGDFDASTKYYTKADEGDTYMLVANPNAADISKYYTVFYDKAGLTEDYAFDTNYIQNGVSYSRLEDGVATLISSKEYLGTLNSETTFLEVTCVVWLEGIDSNVITDNIVDTVIKAQLGFYARTQAKA